MSSIRISVAVFAAFALPVAAESDGVIPKIASLLEQARKSVEVPEIECPSSVDLLVGSERSRILADFKEPNLSQESSDLEFDHILVDQYFFAPPSANWVELAIQTGEYSAVAPLGEYFTVLQIHYDSSNKVVRAHCYDRP
jgi:hypothetical protein